MNKGIVAGFGVFDKLNYICYFYLTKNLSCLTKKEMGMKARIEMPTIALAVMAIISAILLDLGGLNVYIAISVSLMVWSLIYTLLFSAMIIVAGIDQSKRN